MTTYSYRDSKRCTLNIYFYNTYINSINNQINCYVTYYQTSGRYV